MSSTLPIIYIMPAGLCKRIISLPYIQLVQRIKLKLHKNDIRTSRVGWNKITFLGLNSVYRPLITTMYKHKTNFKIIKTMQIIYRQSLTETCRKLTRQTFGWFISRIKIHAYVIAFEDYPFHGNKLQLDRLEIAYCVVDSKFHYLCKCKPQGALNPANGSIPQS